MLPTGRARSESEEESDGAIGSEDGSPRHAVVIARADSDQEEKQGDEEDEEDDEAEDDELLDFTQTEYAMSQMSQSAEPAPGSQDAEASNPKTPAVPSKVAQLSDKVRRLSRWGLCGVSRCSSDVLLCRRWTT